MNVRNNMNTYHRVSRGSCCPWQSHTERKVRRPGALSVAGSRGTPQITGVDCGAETRHSERRADSSGVSGNAGTTGRSSQNSQNSGQTSKFWTFSNNIVSSNQLKKLVGTPRFELGTPCTPCEQSLRSNTLTNKAFSGIESSRINTRRASLSSCFTKEQSSDSGRFPPTQMAAIRERSGGRCECMCWKAAHGRPPDSAIRKRNRSGEQACVQFAPGALVRSRGRTAFFQPRRLMMIKPTIGRVVWYAPSPTERFSGDDGSQRWAALITNVWSDTCVNLAVFDPNGVASSRTSVLLVQDGNPMPGASFCEWMPFQKGQAAKTEALEAAAAEKAA